MKKIILSLCVAFTLTAVCVQAQNLVYDANAEVRTVSTFNKIRVSSAISLYLSQGKEQAVAVSAGDKEYTARIKTQVNNGVLKIYVESGMWNGWNWSNRHLKAYVTFTELQMLDASGASSVEITDPITLNNDLAVDLSGASSLRGEIKALNLNFDISGASNARVNTTAASYTVDATGASTFKGKVNGDKMKFDLSGASVVDVEGSTGTLSVGASGASDFKGYGMQTGNCKADATGASSISIVVNKELDARASGASNIHYSGTGVITNLDISGSSTVKKKS